MAQGWNEGSEFREIKFGEIWNSTIRELTSDSPFMKVVFYGAILLFIVLLALNSVYVVEPGEEGIIRRFGKYVRSTPSGMHAKLPIIDRVDVVDVKNVETLEFGFRTEKAGIRTQYSAMDFPEESEMLTGDMNIIDIDFAVQYRIGNARDFLFNVRNPVDALRNASEAVMRQLIGDRGFDEIRLSRDEIEIEARDRIQKLMDTYGAGILVIYVKTQEINPPRKVMSAWDAVNKAEQYKDEMNNLAQQKYNEAIPRATGHASQVVNKARAYAIQRINRAEGEKKKFLLVLNQYQQAREVTRRRIFLETMETILTQIDEKIIIDQDVSNNIFNLLNLEAR